jgi:hypothetical protein
VARGEARRVAHPAGGRAPEDDVRISREAFRPRERRRDQLTPEQQSEVRRLEQIDARVRAHEAAHQAAGGGAAGAASFTFQMGPDGKAYAVAGEVPIRGAEGRTPDETIAAARRMRAAALAPADPSAQDLAVAAQAAAVEAQAQAAKSRAAGAPPARHLGVQAYERVMSWGEGGSAMAR